MTSGYRARSGTAKRIESHPKIKPNHNDAEDDPINWDAIKADYRRAELSVKDLCRKHDISQSRFYKIARAENLPRRKKDKTKAGLTNQPTSTLQEALEYITMELMNRIKQTSTIADANHEKDARTLSSLVRTYEKLNDIKENTSGAIGKQGRKKQETQSNPEREQDADSRRKEIAASLEKLIKGL